MPIRFRCAYCNQLMGIARRKAGTVVRCPNCAGQVVVPRPEGDQPEPAEAKPVPSQQPPLFEQDDFDDALRYKPESSQGGMPASDPESVSRPIPAPATYQGDVDDYEGIAARAEFPAAFPLPGAPPGILLSRGMATVVSIIIVVALALAFVAGLLVGRAIFARAADERLTRTELRAEWRLPPAEW